MNIHLTLESSNVKTGPIPVSTTSGDTCPPSCPFYGRGCYASSGPLKLHWDKVTQEQRGDSLGEFCAKISNLPAGQLWRHNQAGDLPGRGEIVDVDALQRIVDSNKGRRGFTYTHKPMAKRRNREAVRKANLNGFTVNLSANNLAHADTMAALGIAPVVAVVPSDTQHKFTTPGGRLGIVCPAQTREGMTCAKCKLCSVASRKIIIGFLPHGTGAKKVNSIVSK